MKQVAPDGTCILPSSMNVAAPGSSVSPMAMGEFRGRQEMSRPDEGLVSRSPRPTDRTTVGPLLPRDTSAEDRIFVTRATSAMLVVTRPLQGHSNPTTQPLTVADLCSSAVAASALASATFRRCKPLVFSINGRTSRSSAGSTFARRELMKMT